MSDLVMDQAVWLASVLIQRPQKRPKWRNLKRFLIQLLRKGLKWRNGEMSRLH